MHKPIIGISGINATDNPGPGCAVARSLKRGDYADSNLIGLSYDVHDPGNYMTDLFANTFLVPYPSHGWQSLRSALEEINRKTGVDTLIPCLDAELPLMIRYKDDLAKMGIRTLLPNENQFSLRSKDLLPRLAQDIGCLHPKTKTVYSLDEMINVLNGDIGLPAVVKGRYYKAYVVHNVETALLKGSEIAAEWGFPLLIQQKIEGQEINLIGLADHEGSLVGRVSIKKQLTTQLGKVWTAVTIFDERLNQLCDSFTKSSGWQGPFELECMINAEGIYLIEINPRFPAWVYFATEVGVNLPERLIDLINKGDCHRSLDYQVGKYLVRYSSEFASDLRYFQNLLAAKNREGL